MAEGFRTNITRPAIETQVKTVTPYAYGRTVLPDQGYEAMTAINLENIGYESVANSNGYTAIIGAHKIPIIVNGEIVDDSYIDSYTSGATTQAPSTGYPRYFGIKQVVLSGTQAVTVEFAITLKNVSGKDIYVSGIVGTIMRPVGYVEQQFIGDIDNPSTTTETLEAAKLFTCVSGEDKKSKIRIASITNSTLTYSQEVKAGITGIYIMNYS